jgi:hypothetical protein
MAGIWAIDLRPTVAPENSERIERVGLAPLDRGANVGRSDKALANVDDHERVSDGSLELRREC